MQRNFGARFILTFGILLGLISSIRVHAQSAVDGAIGGTVVDTESAAIPGAIVLVHNNGTNADQTLKTDSSGYFRALHLQPGLYTVTVTAPGFGTFQSDRLVVQVGLVTDLHARMNIGTASQTVTVSSEAPAINTTTPDFSGLIDQTVLSDLPVNNYRWSAYALQSPGVVESGGFGLLSFRGQSTLLNNITVDGADDNQAFFSEERGRTTVGYSTAKVAIEEFQINTSNYSTEYGRASGGVVNAVTKTGTNSLHGEAYYLDRDSALAAYNNYTKESVQTTPGGPFTSKIFKPTDIRKQYGLGIGGPIIKNRMFFFFAVDRYYHHFPAVGVANNPGLFFLTPSASLPAAQSCQTITSGNDPNYSLDSNACTLQSNLKLATYSAAVTDYTQGLTGLNTMLGVGPRYAAQTIFFPKVDWQINGKNHASFEVNRLRFASPAGQQTNATVGYGLQSFGNIYVRDTWGVAKLDSYLTPTISNEIRYQYGRDFNFAFNMPPSAYERATLLKTPIYTNPFGIPPYVTITNGFNFGTPIFLNRPAYPDERRWQVADTVQWTRGNHSFKFGGDYIHTYDLALNLYEGFGGYVYGNQGTTSALTEYLTDYYLSQNASTAAQANHYSSYTQGLGPLGTEFATGDYSAFIQDEWKVSPRLSLTLGVRYEYEQTGDPQRPNPLVPQTESLPHDRNNIAPRVGFAVDVFGTGNTVVRGGYGIFYARLINSTIYQAISQSGAPGGQSTTTLSATQPGAPVFPQVISASTGTPPPPSVVYFDPHFQLPQIHQGDLTVEQNVGWGTVLSVTWLGSFGRDLPNFIDQNLPTPTTVNYTVVNNGLSAPLANGSIITSSFYGYPSSPVAGAVPSPVDQGRPDTRFSSKTNIFSGVNTNYEALVAQINHRVSHHIQFQANYTWSHALDNGENNTTFSDPNDVFDPANPRLDYGNSSLNRPNRLVLTAVAFSPFQAHGWKSYLVNGYEFAPSFAIQNGADFSAGLSGATRNLVSASSPSGYVTGVGNSSNGSDGPIRVPNIQRNAYQLPRTAVLDVRLSKRFTVHDRYQLELLAESFNLVNHQNITAVNTTVYSLGTAKNASGATYNTLTASPSNGVFGAASNSNNNNIYTPRQIQLGARLHF